MTEAAVLERPRNKKQLIDPQSGEPFPAVFIDIDALQRWAAEQRIPWINKDGSEVSGRHFFREEWLVELNRAIWDNCEDAKEKKRGAMERGEINPNDKDALAFG